jgi:hypothetical protein
MGYDIHITRKENWFDQEPTRNISLEEWKDILASDDEMQLDGFAEATTTNGETIRVDNKGLSVWTAYSNNGLNGNHAWFEYSQGNIVCKNPDDETINKMLVIAERLNAKVQGDEGEIYELSRNNKISRRHITESNDNETGRKKHWWKFW